MTSKKILASVLAAGLAALSLLTFAGSSVAAVPRYTATEIPKPYLYSWGMTGLNDLGHVSLWNSLDAYMFNGTSTIHLPVSSPYNGVASGINNSGVVVGYRYLGSSSHVAVQWIGGQASDLHLGPTRTGDSYAQAINNAGVIAGTMIGADGKHLFTYSPLGQVTDQGLLPNYYLSVKDVNERGQMVLMDTGPVQTARFWDSGTYTVLPDLTGGDGGAAYSLNDSGLVVGLSWPHQQNMTAVTWRNGAINTVLPRPADATTSAAYGVNNAGEIVGTNAGRAYIWEPDGTYYDLNSLLDTPTDVPVDKALFINESGQIVCTWSYSRAWILTPIPEPATLSLLALGGLLALRRRR